MIGYIKCFDSDKAMSFRVIDNKLLKNYNKICEWVSRFMNIKFHSEPVDWYIKTKKKLYGDKVNTIFQGKKLPKENASIQMYISNNARFCY